MSEKKCNISTGQESCYWLLVFHRKELKPKEKFPHKLLTTGKYNITLALNVPLKYNLRNDTAYTDQNISQFLDPICLAWYWEVLLSVLL